MHMLYKTMLKQGTWLFRFRGILPFLLIIPGFAIYIHSLKHGYYYALKLDHKLYSIIFYSCFFLSFIGLVIRSFTIGYAAENTSGRNVHAQVAEELNTTGIYSIVRHPLYVGNFIMWIGVTLFFGHFWFALLVIMFFILEYERIMLTEEAFLMEKFGQQFYQWSSRVKAIVPSFKNYVKPSGIFKWKRVIKQEKNGLIAIFLLFSIMDVMPLFFGYEKNTHIVFNVITVFFVFLYVIYKFYKILKKMTK